jgi:PAS domain S-box-containing protein
VENEPPSKTDQQPLGTLRQQATEIVERPLADASPVANHELQRLVYELQIHQVELELQNQQLTEAQLALASSRDQYADLYDFAPLGYLTLDSSGVIVECNITAASLLGVGRESLLRSKFSRYVAPDSQDASYLYWKSLFNGAARKVCELQMRRAGNGTGWVRLEGISVKSLQQAETLCRVAIVDIEDVIKARSELELLNTELEERVFLQVSQIELLARALAGIREGVIITSDHSDWLGSRVVFANRAACEMLGCTSEAAIGQTPQKLLVRDSIELADSLKFQALLDANQSFQTELNYSLSEGISRIFEMSVSPLSDQRNQRTNYVLVQRDITARKREKQQLRDREARLQAILDTAPDAIITIDRYGLVQNCNPAVERLFGFTVAELTGKNISCVMPAPYPDEHDTYLRHFRETGVRRIIGSSRRLIAQHRDGHIFPINLSVNEIDHMGLYLGIVKDVSDLDNLQRQVLRTSDEVQRHIGQSLHDGPQQVLAGLSLLARSLQIELHRRESPLERDADRLHNGIRDAIASLRNLARGLFSAPLEDSDLTTALEGLAHRSLEDYGIPCEFDCPETITISDHYVADQLYHIAQEAVMNAVKHSGSDLIRIILERSGKNISLRISDNGTGFDSKEQANSGLGLYIMPYRAATIGADLEIYPADEGGTVVSCNLISF